MTTKNELRYKFWRKGWVAQHRPSRISQMLKDVFEFGQVRFGDIKKGQGDIVIINLKDENDFVSFKDYISHFLGIKKIEKEGIYTNIYFSDKFFVESIKEINS